MLAPWKEGYDESGLHIKKQRHHFADKDPYSQIYGSSNVQLWELDHNEGWVPKNWCFQTVVLENTLESPLGNEEINLSILKDINLNIHWKTDAEATILWPPDMTSQFTGKDPDVGKDWRQEEKGMTEDEIIGWHHRLNGHEFEQFPGVGDGRGSLACCSP